MKGKVELVLPVDRDESTQGNFKRNFISEVSSGSREDIYGLVERFREEVFPELEEEDLRAVEVDHPMALEDVINLHNRSEIVGRSDVKEMLEKVKSGREILMPDGAPNVKVTETKQGNVVLFDGHHTLLAYMLAGNEFLSQVPHIRVNDQDRSGFDHEEILCFFGEHADKLEGDDWRDYTVSWTKPEAEQLEPRKWNDMGELLEALLRDRDFEPEKSEDEK
ncbi:hypothetical protein KGY71_06065 [Candidatus Bipolaricaulota bacterium]|nr:hypothetical protein [Candidatus Bipolaricaulota bacterium]